MTEVNVGALSGYPVPMVQVTVTDDLQVQMQVEHLATFDWYGRPVDAVAYTRDHACNLLRRLLSAGSPADFAQKLDALQLPGASCCLCIHWQSRCFVCCAPVW